MASAQVLSESSKKDELREAGRRRLEEFRKKKGAKKSAAARTSDSTIAEKQSDHGLVKVDSASPDYRNTDGVTATSGFTIDTENVLGFGHDNGPETAQQEKDNFKSDYSSSSAMLPVSPEQGSRNNAPDLEYRKDSIYVQNVNPPVATFETDVGDGKHEEPSHFGRLGGLQDAGKSGFASNFYGGDKGTSASQFFPDSNASSGSFAATVHSEGRLTSLFHKHDEPASVHPNSDSQRFVLGLDHKQHGTPFKNDLTFNIDERRGNGSVGGFSNFGSERASEPLSEGLNSYASAQVPGLSSSAVADTYFRRSRPSFLDSLNIGRDSPASAPPFGENKKVSTSTLTSSDISAPSWVQDPVTSAPVEPLPTPVYSSTSNDYFGNGFMEKKTLENSMDSNLLFNSQRPTEDFSALEQHIEDLTQEKFSLQRAMEASKALAESLATENSSLTESYNQQAGLVSQLKAEMERLQEEIKAQMVELEAVKAEFTNAHLECNAADERAKLLASEVISLEEKALRLRSNELKLERELENSTAEIASCKKKMSSLEKERRDLQQTIDALQEEKKMLQSKLRQASTRETSVDLKRKHNTKDAHTSTNDLENTSEPASSTILHDDTDNLLSLLENTSAAFEDISMIIPPDQVQVIQNINSLLSEIKSEKEEVTQALICEISTNAKLKEMNKELSHKLEVQTQRLELLTAQSMASEIVPVRQPPVSHTARETVAYADEGDEVVERVLGWIMKLFPGGPSKRRTSRL
ncbi:hypothetical protein vseg_014951 [Gypsophila vaccaria]